MTKNQPSSKILLIDDDEVDVRAVKRAFRHLFHPPQLHVETNGLDALARLRSMAIRGPLIILLDLNMPKMNGFEFLDALRADPDLRHHVVFVLSTSEAERDVKASYQRCAAGYLMKSEIGARPQVLTELVSTYFSAVHLPS